MAAHLDSQSTGPEPKGETETLARGAVVNALTLAAANFRAVFTFLIARLLGEAALGVFALAYATTDLLSKFGTFGLDLATIPLVAQAEARGDRSGSRAVFRIATRFALAAGTATALLGGILILALGGRLGQPPALVKASALMLVALPGLSLYRVSNGLSRGFRVMHHDLLSRGLAETWITIGAFLLAWAGGQGERSPVWAVIAGTTAGGMVAFALASGLTRRHAGGAEPTPTARQVLGFSAPIAGYGLVNLLIQRLDVLLLGAFVGRAPGVTLVSFGVYCAAVEVAGGLRKVRQTFDPIFAPVIAARMLDPDARQLIQILARVGRWVLATQLPAIGVLALSGGLVLSVFGPGFRSGELALLVLGLAHGTNAFVGLAETVIMVRRPGLNFLNATLTAAVQAAATLLLISRYGVLGAAFGTLLAYALQGLLRFSELRLIFGWTWPWASLRRPATVFAVALVPGLAFRALAPGLIGQAAAAAALLAAYILTWIGLGVEPEEKTALRRVFRWRSYKNR